MKLKEVYILVDKLKSGYTCSKCLRVTEGNPREGGVCRKCHLKNLKEQRKEKQRKQLEGKIEKKKARWICPKCNRAKQGLPKDDGTCNKCFKLTKKIIELKDRKPREKRIRIFKSEIERGRYLQY